MEALIQLIQKHKDDKIEDEWINMPLKFESMEDEISMLMMKCMMDFGRGFSQWLPRDWSDLMLLGFMNFHISGKMFDKDFCGNINAMSLSTIFNFSIGIEKEIMPGVYKLEDGPLRLFADQLVSILQNTRLDLEENGCDNVGQFLLRNCDRYGSADELANFLATSLSGFRDDSGVCRKAKLCVQALHQRYHAEEHNPFHFDGIDEMSCLIDAEIMGALREKSLVPQEPIEFVLPADAALESALAVKALAVTEELTRKAQVPARLVEMILKREYRQGNHDTIQVRNSLNY